MNQVPFQGKRKRLLLHGPAIEASRRKLQELRKKFNSDSILVFEKDENIGNVLTNLVSRSLFDDERLIIIENPSEAFKLPGDAMTDGKITLILWFDQKVDIKEWPGFEEVFFPENREISVFPFLDFLAAGDIRAFLEIEKLKKAKLDIHYFLTMVFYLLRNLVAIPETAPSFVKQKLAKQRSNFSKVTLTKLYKDILEIDFKLKLGFLEKDHAEFLLINKFIESPTL